ncbi:hypothetical protein [Gemmatirosa kalamazoonensis]|nr:hypothetical protein [Gemmatirosa kalamazoonensis]
MVEEVGSRSTTGVAADESVGYVVVGGAPRRFRLVSLAAFDPWGADPPNGLAYLDPLHRAVRIDESERDTASLALEYFDALGATLRAFRDAIAGVDADAMVRAPWRRALNAPYAAAARAARPRMANLSPCVTRLHAETRWDGAPRRAMTPGELAPFVHVSPPLDPPLVTVRHLLIVDAAYRRGVTIGAVWFALLAAGLSADAEVTVAVALRADGSGPSLGR